MLSKKIVAEAIIDKIKNENDDVDIRTNLVEGYKNPDTFSTICPGDIPPLTFKPDPPPAV